MRLLTLLAVALAALLAGTAAGRSAPVRAAAIPYDFQIEVTAGIPPVQLDTLPPKCSAPDADGVYTCTSRGSAAAVGLPLAGVVREASTGRSGTLDAVCRWDGRRDTRGNTFEATVRATSLTSMELTALAGYESQDCSWRVTVGASSIAGMMSGGGYLSPAGPATGSYSGTLAVFVSGGTGEFAGLVGSGTYAHNQEFPIPFPTPFRRVAAAAVEPSRLQLSLHEGKARVLVSSPAKTLTKATDSGLRVVSVPGASCKAVASKGTRRVKLGPVRDSNRDGLVVVASKLRPKLAPGRWSIAVSCAYTAAGKTATASGRVVTAVS